MFGQRELSVVQFQKISILSERKRLEFPREWGISKKKEFKGMYEFKEIYFYRGGEGVLEKKIPLWGGMDIFWDYTLKLPQK